jgi:hypothetical protein
LSICEAACEAVVHVVHPVTLQRESGDLKQLARVAVEHLMNSCGIWSQATDGCDLLGSDTLLPGAHVIVAVAPVQELVLMPLQEVSRMVLVTLERIQARSC